jgi:GH24 family phage-related lysozyme (muramidase)
MYQSVRDAFYDFNAPMEGVVSWMYLDIKGFVTVGVGNLLPDADSAAALPFIHGDDPAAVAADD